MLELRIEINEAARGDPPPTPREPATDWRGLPRAARSANSITAFRTICWGKMWAPFHTSKEVYVAGWTAGHLGPRGRPSHQTQPLPDAPLYPQADRGAGGLARAHPRDRGGR